MKWTKDLPKESGYYWMKYNFFDEVRIRIFAIQVLFDGINIFDGNYVFKPKDYEIIEWGDEKISLPIKE